ncbi:uncharacterized protein akap1a isoform X2 [Brachyhypopomus gauderio]|uniref:uncharacterized protein akap1a isoform X2 n=1 Tax=Brachyhypopomus gauderio TaxID=698409 RepID=UPI0040419EC1
MLPRLLRPLVPFSALALLGWCWYVFRRKRRACMQVEKDDMATCSLTPSSADVLSLDKQGASVYDTALTPQNRHMSHLQQEHGSSSGSCNGDQSLDLEDSGYSSLNSTIDHPVLSASSPYGTPISSPSPRLLKGLRPDPEGRVSEIWASVLLAEKPDAETEDVVSRGFRASEMDSAIAQTTRTVSFRRRGAERQFLKRLENFPSSTGKDVPHTAMEEILVSGDSDLKRNRQQNPCGNPMSEAEIVTQDHLEMETSMNGSLLVTSKELHAPTTLQTGHGALSGAVEEQECVQPMSPSAAEPQEDSGDSARHVGDRAGLEDPSSRGEAHSALLDEGALATGTVDSECKTQEPHLAVAGRSEKGSKGANGVKCVSGVGGGSSGDGAAPLPSSLLGLWEVEVPAHLVGRLIGKQGKHIGFLKQNSGAKIYVSTLPYTHDFQICHIEGSEVQVENALALIRKKFKDLDLSNRSSGAQPSPLTSVPLTSWLLLPQERSVEVMVPRVEAVNYLFVQQHTHPSYYSLQGLTEHMHFCYSQPGCPGLPAPVEAGVLCAAPSAGGSWWRAQVIQHYRNSNMVQIRYVDYGGYVTVNLGALRQIRSDFVSLPFQASEVMLENIAPLPGMEDFSLEAKEALEELTQGVSLIIKVSGAQSGLPLVHMWRQAGEEMISVNGLLVERGFCSWLDSH